jgi:hypothetical protein
MLNYLSGIFLGLVFAVAWLLYWYAKLWGWKRGRSEPTPGKVGLAFAVGTLVSVVIYPILGPYWLMGVGVVIAVIDRIVDEYKKRPPKGS